MPVYQEQENVSVNSYIVWAARVTSSSAIKINRVHTRSLSGSRFCAAVPHGKRYITDTISDCLKAEHYT